MGVGVAAGTTAVVVGADAAATAGVGAAVAGTAAVGTAAAATTTASILSTVGEIGAGLSGAVGALGAIESADATQKTAQYQAQVAANNQQIAKSDANMSEAAGEQAVEQQGLKTRATVGAIEAGQAASNVDVNSGSAVDVRSSASELGQLNQLTTQANAQKQAYGYETVATSEAGQESLAQSEAAQAPIAGAISAGGSLLSGATGVSNQYASWQKVGGTATAAAGSSTAAGSSGGVGSSGGGVWALFG